MLKKTVHPEAEDKLRQGRVEGLERLHNIDEQVSQKLEEINGVVPQIHLQDPENCRKYLTGVVGYGLVYNTRGREGFFRFDYLTGSIYVDVTTGEIQGIAIPETAGVAALASIVQRRRHLLE